MTACEILFTMLKTAKTWEILLVPGAGVEPAHPYEREILSLLCLPISPPGRMEGVHQIAVRILTLTKIFSAKFHSFLHIFSSYSRIFLFHADKTMRHV